MIPVLVADDDSAIRDAIGALLLEEGYEPVEAASLGAALALLDERVFALILTDLFSHGQGSPLGDISALVERAHPTPVGVISGWPLTTQDMAASRCAFALLKPFDIDDLLAHVAGAIDTTLTPEQQRQAEHVHRYFAALSKANWEALLDLCADDIRYTLPDGGPFSTTLRGKSALRAYSAETFRHFPAACFENVRVYATPQGLAARFESEWLTPMQGTQRQSGGVVFHFDGDLIRQIGVEINDARLRALMTLPSASTGDAAARA